ncbi:hypothetical protein F4604DRAFT_1691462 [Suillus subluteus]|nr:hypothetical protein F4604DRAFT_1691462 [Suillus subluteus]
MPKDSQCSSEEVLCDIYGVMIQACGLVSHMRKCKKQERLRIEQTELTEILQESSKIVTKSLANLTSPYQSIQFQSGLYMTDHLLLVGTMSWRTSECMEHHPRVTNQRISIQGPLTLNKMMPISIPLHLTLKRQNRNLKKIILKWNITHTHFSMGTILNPAGLRGCRDST